MNIKDLAGISEPIKKLIEVLSKGVGKLSSSYFIRKEAEAHAYELEKIMDTIGNAPEQENLDIEYMTDHVSIKTVDKTLLYNLPENPLNESLAERVKFKELKGQLNTEQITSIAAEKLASTETVSEEPLDDDWINSFFRIAEDISTPEMQDLWGRILSGEIIQPGSYSLRTLDFIKKLSKKEANNIEKIGKYAVNADYTSFIIEQDEKWLTEHLQINPVDLFYLGELGVIYPTKLGYQVFMNSDIFTIKVCNKNIMVKKEECNKKLIIGVWKYTDIGRELLTLIKQKDSKELVEKIESYFVTQKCKVYIN